MTKGKRRPAPGRPDAHVRNCILAALPRAEYRRCAPSLERVPLELRQLLFDVDEPIAHVYFCESAVVSVVSIMSDGTAVETATVGNEGMVGLPVFHGVDRTAAQAFCQIPGEALRMTTSAFQAELRHQGALGMLLGRYAEAMFTQVAQSSACNRVHPMRERCARWLLTTHDRVGGDEFPLTHRFLAQMLGVRRATVTEAAGSLQEAGLIEYRMGRVLVLDRLGLETASCECYAIIRRAFGHLLAAHVPPNPLAGVPTSKGDKSLAKSPKPRKQRGAGS
jgi:CRP-like cAMP-binding protein